MNLVIKQTRVVEVPVNTITLAATCQQAMLIDADGQCVGSTASMPSFMPTLLEIDLATGQIKNWCVPTGEQLQDIADTSEIQRMSEGEYHHFMNDRLFRDAVPLEQSNPPEIEGIKTDDQGIVDSHFAEVEEGIVMFGGAVPDAESVTTAQQLDLVRVWYDAPAGKWTAQIEDILPSTHQATSTQGKFEAIKNVLKKAGLTGTYEINKASATDDLFYSYDDTRTKDRLSVYVGGYEVGKGYTARTGKGHKYTAENPELALDGLISHALKVTLLPNAIVQTTDDATVFNDKQRYSIDMSKALAIVEPSTTEPDWADGRRDRANDIEIEDAPQPICQPARVRYRNPDDHSQTWTGRGKPPQWLQAKLDNGAQLGDYRIAIN